MPSRVWGGDDTNARTGLREQLVLSLPKAPTLSKLHIASFKLVEGFFFFPFLFLSFSSTIHTNTFVFIPSELRRVLSRQVSGKFG